jgi:glycosyltransferase involved in cell wall biosynthesis
MKILSVNHLLDAKGGGGTAERTFQLARFFSCAGAEVTVLTLDIGIDKARHVAMKGINLVAVPCLNLRYFVPRISLSAIDQLVATADIVHLSGHWTILNALVYWSCHKQKKPFVFCPAGALTAFGRSRGIKLAYDVLVGRSIAKAAAACVAITNHERKDFAEYGVQSDYVTVIPNGIDPMQYEQSEYAQIQENFPQKFEIGNGSYLLFLGRLNEIKGPDLLLAAFAKIEQQFPGLKLVYAGPDGGMQALLQASALHLGIQDKVHFTGFLSGIEKVTALRGAKLLAIPSRREAMSIVVLEAGVCRTPVLFTDNCGLDEFAKMKGGLMVRAEAGSLAAGLVTLLSDSLAAHDSVVRLESIVRENYLWKIQADHYLQLFEQIIKEHS